MAELTTPISEGEIEKLRAGDVVYLNGLLVVARDKAHARLLELLSRGQPPPIELKGLAVYHAGPVAVKVDGWRILSMGPTTSSRFEAKAVELAHKAGVRLIIGKGGLNPEATSRLRQAKAIYASYPGGVGALPAKSVIKVVKVEWLDLGLPEALWLVEVRRFGPLLISVDLHGGDLYLEVKRKVEENRLRILGLGPRRQP
ncbi:MAG: fumarate hydratase [Thermoprotei archaeon]|nr:MAG: fumarate hydratase [Thermoprotei archaeon]